MAFDPDAFLNNRDSEFDPNAFLGELEQEPGYLESFARGAAQGATFGFADEIAAGIRALGPGTYEEEIAKSRARDRAAQEANPKTFLAGDVATMFIPGTGAAGLAGKGLRLAGKANTAAKLAKLKGLRGALVGGALEGALYGAGTAEGGLADRLVGTAKGATLGSVIGGGASQAPRILSPIKKTVIDPTAKTMGSLGRKGLAAITQTGEESIEQYARRPEQVRAAMKDPEALYKTSQDLTDVVEGIRSQSVEGSGRARGILEETGTTFNKEDVIRSIDDAIDRSKSNIDLGDEKAVRTLRNLKENIIAAEGSELTGQAMKDIIQKIDPIAYPKMGTEFYGASAKDIGAVRDVRGYLDRQLKERIPEYGQEMQRVADDLRMAEMMKKEVTGGSIDTLSGRLKRIGKGATPGKADLLRRLDDYAGEGFSDRLKDIAAAQDFLSDKTRGSLNMIAPVGVGGAYGGIPGALAGAGLGYIKGKYGGRMAPTAIDIGGQLSKILSANPQAFGKYGPILSRSKERGGIGLAATHYLLQKKDPEYKKTYDEIVEGL